MADVTNPRRMFYDLKCDASTGTYSVQQNVSAYQDTPANAYGTGNIYRVSKLYRDAYGTYNTPDGVSQQWVLMDGAPLVTKLPDSKKSNIYLKLLSFNSFGGGKQELADVEPWIIPLNKLQPYTITGSISNPRIGSECYGAGVMWKDGVTNKSNIILNNNPIFAGDINNHTRYYNQEEFIDGSALSKTLTTPNATANVFDVIWAYNVNPIPDYFMVYLVGYSPDPAHPGKVLETVLSKRQTTNGRIRQLALTQDSVSDVKFTSFGAYVVPIYNTTPTPVLYETGPDIELPAYPGQGNHPRTYTTGNAPTLIYGSVETPGAIINSMDLDVDTYALITSAGDATRTVTWSGFGSDYTKPGARLQVALTEFTEAHDYAGQAAHWTKELYVPPAPTPCCFPPGSLVLMADHTTKVIETVKPGDQVLTYNTETGDQEVGTVGTLTRPMRDNECTLTFVDGSTLKVSDDHPLWSYRRGERSWRAVDPQHSALYYDCNATQLEVGDSLLNSDDVWVNITKIDRVEGVYQMYSLGDVSPNKDFFVSNDKHFVVAHNRCCLLGGVSTIYMEDGTDKDISEVHVGDRVLCFDPDSNEANTATVAEVRTPVRQHYFEILLMDGRSLCITGEHPIYTLSGWKAVDPDDAKTSYKMDVGKLEVGDGVHNSNGTFTEVTRIRRYNKQVQTYTLHNTDPFHTFYVNGVLVHNYCD